MTDDEIIKALECCCFTDTNACEECPLYNTFDCSFVIIDKTLDLVNRQNAEIERLKQENKEYCEDNRIIAYQRNQRDKEIRALHNQLNGLNFMDKQIKSESVKKFAEKLKDKAIRRQEFIGELAIDDVEYVKTQDISETLKEFIK